MQQSQYHGERDANVVVGLILLFFFTCCWLSQQLLQRQHLLDKSRVLRQNTDCFSCWQICSLPVLATCKNVSMLGSQEQKTQLPLYFIGQEFTQGYRLFGDSSWYFLLFDTCIMLTWQILSDDKPSSHMFSIKELLVTSFLLY